MNHTKKGVEAERKQNESEIRKKRWGVNKSQDTRFREILQGWCFKSMIARRDQGNRWSWNKETNAIARKNESYNERALQEWV